MKSIEAAETLTGYISSGRTLVGSMSTDSNLAGKMSVIQEYERYDGDYTVTPLASCAQVLLTKDKVLTKDVVIEEIPFWETSNESDGKTVYIGNGKDE